MGLGVFFELGEIIEVGKKEYSVYLKWEDVIIILSWDSIFYCSSS